MKVQSDFNKIHSDDVEEVGNIEERMINAMLGADGNGGGFDGGHDDINDGIRKRLQSIGPKHMNSHY